MSRERDELSSCLGLDGNIYVAGGVSKNNLILSHCEKFNFSKMCWQNLPNMIKNRRSFVLVALPQGIYAIGGHDGKKYLSEMEFFCF